MLKTHYMVDSSDPEQYDMVFNTEHLSPKSIARVLVSMIKGKTLAYALFSLQDRGRLFTGAGMDVYEGQIVGLHSRSNDLPVNPTKAKQLTNVRAAGTDENLILTPPVQHTLEQALEFIESDELVEVTPNAIRLRKKLLTETERKRSQKAAG